MNNDRSVSFRVSHPMDIESLQPLSLPEFLETQETKFRRNVSFRVSSQLHHSLRSSNFLFLLHILHSPIHHKHYHVSILLFPSPPHPGVGFCNLTTTSQPNQRIFRRMATSTSGK